MTEISNNKTAHSSSDSTAKNNMLVLRSLEESDYDLGIMKLYSQLTESPDVGRERFTAIVRELKGNAEWQQVYVVEDVERRTLVACCTLLIEQKFIRGGGKAGHIEDVVVDESCRGKNVGKWMMTHCTSVARARGCYKIILDCKRKNVPFYKKCGFEENECCMRAAL
jgi:glucosamine-phosphate N-acetyltransferase